MTLKLYYDLMSQPSRALYIFLKATNTPFEPCLVNLISGKHLTPQFKQQYSKFQKVPFIHDGDFRLAESIGIIRYLTREKSIPDNWYPKDSKAQAKVDEYLEWQHLNIRLFCAMYFQANFLLPKMGKELSEETCKFYERGMLKALSQFEEFFLSNGTRFMFGEKISYADLAAACEIEQPRIAGFDPRDHYPKIKAWIENVRQECNPYYDEAHKFLNKVAANSPKAKL